MSREVQDFEAFIKSDAKNSLLIQDENTGKKIDHKFTADKLQDYGDLKSYLSHLYDNGHRVLVITKRRKNGNTDSQVRGTVAQKLTLNKTKEADPSDLSSKPAQNAGGPAQPNTQPMQTNYPPQPQVGMSGDIAKLYADSERYQDYKRWYEEAAKDLKEKKEELEKTKEKWKDKYDELKDKFNDFKYDKKMEDKPGTIDKLVNAITERPELLSSVMQALPQGIKQNQLPQQGMQGANQLDETSQSAAMAINNLTDDDKETIINVINHYALGTENFIPELQQLVETHSEELKNALEKYNNQQRSA